MVVVVEVVVVEVAVGTLPDFGVGMELLRWVLKGSRRDVFSRSRLLQALGQFTMDAACC